MAGADPASIIIENAFAAGRDESAAAGIQRGATVVQHVDSVLVAVGAGDARSPTVNNVIGARRAVAAGAHGSEEIVVIAMIDDLRVLDVGAIVGDVRPTAGGFKI